MISLSSQLVHAYSISIDPKLLANIQIELEGPEPAYGNRGCLDEPILFRCRSLYPPFYCILLADLHFPVMKRG